MSHKGGRQGACFALQILHSTLSNEASFAFLARVGGGGLQLEALGPASFLQKKLAPRISSILS